MWNTVCVEDLDSWLLKESLPYCQLPKDTRGQGAAGIEKSRASTTVKELISLSLVLESVCFEFFTFLRLFSKEKGKHPCMYVVFSKILTQLHESRTWGSTKSQQTAHSKNTLRFLSISALLSVSSWSKAFSKGAPWCIFLLWLNIEPQDHFLKRFSSCGESNDRKGDAFREGTARVLLF